MELSINQTSSAINNINQLQRKREEDDEKAASGLRINSAADDPAGLQIANRLTAEINESAQLSINARDQINLNTVQEGGLSAINDNLQRANELAISAGNPLNDSSIIQGELNQLTDQINTIAGEVLNDSNFIAGFDASDPSTTQDTINNALDTVNETAAALGANSNGLSSQISTYDTSMINSSAARSRIQDTDFAANSSEQTRNDILLQSAIITKRDDEEARKGLLVNQLV